MVEERFDLKLIDSNLAVVQIESGRRSRDSTSKATSDCLNRSELYMYLLDGFDEMYLLDVTTPTLCKYSPIDSHQLVPYILHHTLKHLKTTLISGRIHSPHYLLPTTMFISVLLFCRLVCNFEVKVFFAIYKLLIFEECASTD